MCVIRLSLLVVLTLNLVACNEEATESAFNSQSLKGDKGDPGSFKSVSMPMQLSAAQRNDLYTTTGWLNTYPTPVMIYGTIQLWAVNQGCRSADLKVKWSDSTAWMTLQHYYHGNMGTANSGARYNPTLMLAPGARIKIDEMTSDGCNSSNNGSLYKGEEWYISVAQ